VPSGSACAAKTRQRKPPVSGAPPPFRTAERLSVAWAESLAGAWAGPFAGVWAAPLAGVWAGPFAGAWAAPPAGVWAGSLAGVRAGSLAAAWAGALGGAWGESLAGVWAPAGAITATSATKAARIRHVGLNPPRIAENGRRRPMALEGPGRLVTPH
jgi:hypothetical protein